MNLLRIQWFVCKQIYLTSQKKIIGSNLFTEVVPNFTNIGTWNEKWKLVLLTDLICLHFNRTLRIYFLMRHVRHSKKRVKDRLRTEAERIKMRNVNNSTSGSG